MGLFSKGPKVPNTISNRRMAELQRRQAKYGEPMFSRKSRAQREASDRQMKKAWWN